MPTGRFIVIDGIAGSGKTTIAQAAAGWAERCGHRVFRLADAEKERGLPPRFDEIQADVLFTYEPSRTWIGGAIRGELSRTDDPYDGAEMAHAFALDRHLLYKRLILPALAAGKTVIQDRSVSTSIVYQPIMPGGLPLEELLKLPGNAQAMKRPPDHLVLTRVRPETVAERLAKRDNSLKAFSAGATGIFVDIEYMKKVDERFRAPWYRELWEKAGTQVHEIDTERPLTEVQADAERLIETLLPIC